MSYSLNSLLFLLIFLLHTLVISSPSILTETSTVRAVTCIPPRCCLHLIELTVDPINTSANLSNREGGGGGADEAEDEDPPRLGRPPLLLRPPSAATAAGAVVLPRGHLPLPPRCSRPLISRDSSSTARRVGGQAHASPRPNSPRPYVSASIPLAWRPLRLVGWSVGAAPRGVRRMIRSWIAGRRGAARRGGEVEVEPRVEAGGGRGREGTAGRRASGRRQPSGRPWPWPWRGTG